MFGSNFLICLKVSSSLVPYLQGLPLHVRSHQELDIAENPRMNFAQNWEDPQKYRTNVFWSILGSRGINSGFHFLLGCLHSLSCEDFSHVLHALGSNDTLFIVKDHFCSIQTCTLLCQGFYHTSCCRAQLFSHRRGNPSVFSIVAVWTSLLPYTDCIL